MSYFLLLILLFNPQLPPREVSVAVSDHRGQAVIGQVVRLEVIHPRHHDECTTDRGGRCTFTFSAPEQLYNGRLLLVGRGHRSLVWRGDLHLELQLDDQGQLLTHTDFIPTETPFLELTATATAVAPEPTASLTATVPATTATPTRRPFIWTETRL